MTPTAAGALAVIVGTLIGLGAGALCLLVSALIATRSKP